MRKTKAQLESELNELRAALAAQTKKKTVPVERPDVEHFDNGARAEIRKSSDGRFYMAYFFTERTRKPMYVSLEKLASLEDNWDRLVDLAESL